MCIENLLFTILAPGASSTCSLRRFAVRHTELYKKKIVVKLRLYNDLLLFEGLFEDPREGFLKPISGERGIRTPETLLTFTRFPGVPLQPLEHLSLAT